MGRKRNRQPPPRSPFKAGQQLAARATLDANLSPPAKTLRQPPRHKPDINIDRAQIAWEERRYEDAIRHYESALARDPQNPVLLVDVARTYALRYRYADAQQLIERAQALHPDDAHLHEMLGRSYVQIQQFDRAIACYRRALELAPTSPTRPQTLLELSKMLERLHDLEGARKSVLEALELAPGFEKARYMLAIIDRRAGDVSTAEARLRELIDARRAPPGVIADSWYQLAAIFDSAGRHDEAFEALLRAKQIFSQAAGPYQRDAATIAKISGRTFDTITAEHCQRWNAAAGELNPLRHALALLTSHPRSGTTLLEQVLDSHPNAISADELQIMADLVYLPLGRRSAGAASLPEALDRATSSDIAEVRLAYHNAMEGALRQPIGQRLLVDKNPELTLLLPLVARVFPEMKIVFALRDPRDVVISCFMQRLPLNPVSVHYLTLERTARKYVATMNAWLKIRPMLKNPWIEVRYEDTVADVERQARLILDFLGLPWDDAVLDFQRHAQQKHIHSPTYEAVTRPIYQSSIGRWRNYASQLEPFMGILQPFIAAFGYQ
jgi:tetratricopeptide (TPR) repeat protein